MYIHILLLPCTFVHGNSAADWIPTVLLLYLQPAFFPYGSSLVCCSYFLSSMLDIAAEGGCVICGPLERWHQTKHLIIV